MYICSVETGDQVINVVTTFVWSNLKSSLEFCLEDMRPTLFKHMTFGLQYEVIYKYLLKLFHMLR